VYWAEPDPPDAIGLEMTGSDAKRTVWKPDHASVIDLIRTLSLAESSHLT
jgi:hypothetical protein